jgi:isocitrate dehydrogenase (NAD+)
MLRHINENEAADRIEKAVHTVIAKGEVLTRDLGGTAKTRQYTEELMRHL